MNYAEFLNDPLAFARLCWPDIKLYDKQVEIIESVRDNDETFVPAGNQLGKDFVAGFIALWFFCSRSPCRVVTSSSGQTQLKSVLWGEIRRFLRLSRYPLPVQVNDLLLRQLRPDGSVEEKSYLRGIVTNDPENLQGHHLYRGNENDPLSNLPRTLFIGDEASGIETEYYDAAETWSHRKLIIGNPLPCTNFFFTGVKGGSLRDESNGHYYRKIIHISAEDSPNVRLAKRQEELDKEVTHETLIPGVIDYRTYLKRRATWDPIRQTIGLDGKFYEGAEVLLFPPMWLDRAENLAKEHEGKPRNARRFMGVDTGEGRDNTCWVIVDHIGLLEIRSMKTTDTAVIFDMTKAIATEYKVNPKDIYFDRGGGGKQHADYLRKSGYKVNTVGFGEAATDPSILRRVRTRKEREEDTETRYVYKNRRAEMYYETRLLLDPTHNEAGFVFPPELVQKDREDGKPGLRKQLSPLPVLYDEEGRIHLPPKDKRSETSKEVTIKEMLGCSPDEADALVLAVFGLVSSPRRVKVGAVR